MDQLANSQPHSKTRGRFTGERLLRERPRVYRKVVELLAEPGMSVNKITKLCRVSEHTVRAVRDREAIPIAERKQRLMSTFGNVAEIAAERMEELVGTAGLRDAGITAGIATDKLLALSSDTFSQANNHLYVHLNFNPIKRWNDFLESIKPEDTAAKALPSGPDEEAIQPTAIKQPAERCAIEQTDSQKES